MFNLSSRFSFADLVKKASAAATQVAYRQGTTLATTACQANIVDSQESQTDQAVEMDIVETQDWDVVSSIVKEWWSTQKKRHIVINITFSSS